MALGRGGVGPGRRARGFTLLELLLVIGLMAILAAVVTPNLFGQLRSERLPRSARQLRSLVQLTRANAMLDGRRYRIRFPREEELDEEGTEVQPIIEYEEDPFGAPDVFVPVPASWARGETLLDRVWCVRVRLEKPTVAELTASQDDVMAGLDEQDDPEADQFRGLGMEDFEPAFPPLVIEPDGTSEWATFILAQVPDEVEAGGPRDLDPESLLDYPRVEVIYDGLTGLAWLQRPFYEEELAMLEEHHWPAVLRKDFLRPEPLTENEVIEIQESLVRQ